ncbi:MAG: metallophosphoesterase [Tissierellales bacterium]|nr:metallophosphoesterase [Tissierellales bacterium]
MKYINGLRLKKVKTFLLLILIGIYLFAQNKWVDVDKIKIQVESLPSSLDGFKIVHVSDLHIPHNEIEIEKLIDILKIEKPDIIALTGDIISSGSNLDYSNLEILLEELPKITKVYAVLGNHESRNDYLDEYKEMLKKSNIILLEDEYEISSKDGYSIGIIGLRDNSIYKKENIEDIEKIKDMPIIMLAHRPEKIDEYFSERNSVKPTLVLSGHAHGGQFRIPFLKRGLIAPNQGFFPKYTSGIYKAENGGVMVVSRGLGRSVIPFRINNRIHLPVIELKKTI